MTNIQSRLWNIGFSHGRVCAEERKIGGFFNSVFLLSLHTCCQHHGFKHFWKQDLLYQQTKIGFETTCSSGFFLFELHTSTSFSIMLGIESSFKGSIRGLVVLSTVRLIKAFLESNRATAITALYIKRLRLPPVSSNTKRANRFDMKFWKVAKVQNNIFLVQSDFAWAHFIAIFKINPVQNIQSEKYQGGKHWSIYK